MEIVRLPLPQAAQRVVPKLFRQNQIRDPVDRRAKPGLLLDFGLLFYAVFPDLHQTRLFTKSTLLSKEKVTIDKVDITFVGLSDREIAVTETACKEIARGRVIYGLFLDGARWKDGLLEDQIPNLLINKMCHLHCKAITTGSSTQDPLQVIA